MTATHSQPSIAVLGLGNELLGDDGVGIHGLRRLAQSPPPGVLLAEIGAAVLRAQHIIESVQHIIAIDAIHHDGPPGSIYRFCPDLSDRPCFYGLHDLDLPALVSLIRPKDRPTLTIIGVEPEIIDYGFDLSPAVAAALPELIRRTRETIESVHLNSNTTCSRRAVS